MPIQVEEVQDLFAAGAGTQTIKMMVAGPPGAGKTRFASTWPNPLYADVEGRLLSVRDRAVKRVKIDSTSELEELKLLLDQAPDIRKRMLGFDVKTLVVDTVDEIARMLQKERMRAEKLEALRMQDWGWYGDQLRNMLRGFRNIPDLHVLFLVHVKQTEDSETGRVEKKPDISGAVGNEISGYVDESLLMVARGATDPRSGTREIKRYLQTYPDGQHDWVKDHSGCLPMEVPVNFEDDYKRISEFIFGQPQPAPAPAIEEKVRSSEPMEEMSPVIEERAPRKKVAAKKATARVVETTPRAPIAQLPTVDAPLPEDPPPSKPEPAPVSAKETEDAEPAEGAALVCAECGEPVENPDVAEVSEIRFGVVLCRAHFAARRQKR